MKHLHTYLAIFLFFLTLYVKAQTQQTCGQTPPTGWITISINGYCNGSQISRTIQRIDNLSAGTELNICGESPTPTGWVNLSYGGVCANINNTVYYSRRIKKVDGLPAGTELNVCGETTTPAGWVVKSFGGICATNIYNTNYYTRVIIKVEGLPAGTELNICGDTPTPTGWVVKSFGGICATNIYNTNYYSRTIKKYLGMPYGTVLNICGSNPPTGWTLLSSTPNCAIAYNTNYTGYTIRNGNCSNSVTINASGGLTCDPTTTVNLSADVADPNPVYKWSGPNGFQSNQPSVNATVAGAYNLSVTTANGVCGGIASTNLLVTQTLVSVSITQSGTLTCTNRSVTLSAGNSNYYTTYKWSGPNNFSLITSQSSISVAVGGGYFLAVTGERCGNSGTTTVIENCPTCESSKPGLWTDTATWSCGRIPLITDRVVVGHLITLPTGSVQPARQLIFKTGGQLNKLNGAKLQLSP